MRPSYKLVLVSTLVAAFAAHTALVYSDEGGPRLTGPALEGRRIWHRHACQVCHQLWGQGGFLGPDLTNAGSRVDSARLHQLLTAGTGQMPAFRLAPEEIAAVRAYLVALDRPERGQGQLRMGPSRGAPWRRFAGVATDLLERTATPAARRGWGDFEARRCGACHQPLRPGPGGAPDLSLAASRLSADSLLAVLRRGRPERGMPAPAPALSDSALAEMIDFLRWLGARRDSLGTLLERASPAGPLRWGRLPWWEYR